MVAILLAWFLHVWLNFMKSAADMYLNMKTAATYNLF